MQNAINYPTLMKYTEAKEGRIFILRLEHGDLVTDTIEAFAKAKNIHAAYVQVLGGAEDKSKIVAGPKDGTDTRPEKVYHVMDGVSEMFGVGTLFTNQSGIAKLHLHGSFGRAGRSSTGCCWPGVVTWHIGEVIIRELMDHSAIRRVHEENGFELLEIIE